MVTNEQDIKPFKAYEKDPTVAILRTFEGKIFYTYSAEGETRPWSDEGNLKKALHHAHTFVGCLTIICAGSFSPAEKRLIRSFRHQPHFIEACHLL